jgi:hypothetical protein
MNKLVSFMHQALYSHMSSHCASFVPENSRVHLSLRMSSLSSQKFRDILAAYTAILFEIGIGNVCLRLNAEGVKASRNCSALFAVTLGANWSQRRWTPTEV